MEEFTTIKELETPVKLTRFLYFYDVLFIVIYTFVTYELLVRYVYSKLETLYMINCVLWGIFFILPAVGNSKRPNWRNILNTVANMNAGCTYGEKEVYLNEDLE